MKWYGMELCTVTWNDNVALKFCVLNPSCKELNWNVT